MSARVGKPEVTRTKDGLLLTINIEEGPRFKVSSVGISGQLIAPQKELVAMIKTKPGSWYNREQLRTDLATLHELYANRGFAYVEVRPQVRPKHEDPQRGPGLPGEQGRQGLLRPHHRQRQHPAPGTR